MQNSWLSGIPYEVAFWRSIYRNGAARRNLFAWSRWGKEIQLDAYPEVTDFLSSLSAQGHEPLVLDCGCGLSFCTGNLLQGKPLNLHFVDPLAPYYNRIASQCPLTLPSIEFGWVEYLSSFYPKSDVSLIMVQNALDHSANPLKGILEGLQALQLGGVLYLKHYPNEAEREKYSGFHQFNVCEENGELFIWNKAVRHNVSRLVAPFASVQLRSFDNPVEVVAILTKTAPVPSVLLSPQADVVELSQLLLQQSQSVDSFGFCLSYHFHKVFYGVAQFFLRFCSKSFRDALKRFLKMG